MKICKKSFLFFVGLITISLDRLNEALDEAVAAVEEQREKISEKFS